MRNHKQSQTAKINRPKIKTQSKSHRIKNNRAISWIRNLKEKELKRFYSQIQQAWSWPNLKKSTISGLCSRLTIVALKNDY